MLRISFAVIFSCCALLAGAVAAQTPPDLVELPSDAVPAPLPPPDFVEHDEELEPEITIIQRKDSTVTEYRVNGRLYMIKVTPFIGKPYYFVDRDGDGIMEASMNDDVYDSTQVPQWVIFSW